MSDEQKSALEVAREAAEKAAEETNKARTGVGTRLRVGATRGKNPQVITFEAFDDSLPETLPKSVGQFMEIVTSDEPTLVDYLIRGANAANYEAASDPLKEYVVPSWAPEVQSTFRQAVRNYAKGLNLQLEDAVNIIRPGFVAKFGE